MKKNSKKSPIVFPDPRFAPSVEGVVFIGGDLKVSTLEKAYSLGIFPWPIEGYPLLWHFPEKRGLLFFKDLHVARSLERLRKKNTYHFSFNRCFKEVMEACAKQKRKEQQGTWILPEMLSAYCRFHKAGYAHSVECWNEEGTLVGGLYGVYLKGVFSGESMFHKENNTSKLSLLAMVEKLQEVGCGFIDTQMVTPVLKNMGARYISKNKFLNLFEDTQRKKLPEKLSL